MQEPVRQRAGMLPTLLTELEAANLIGCSIHAVGQLRHDGALPYVRCGGIRIFEIDVQAYIERQKQPSQISIEDARYWALTMLLFSRHRSKPIRPGRKRHK